MISFSSLTFEMIPYHGCLRRTNSCHRVPPGGTAKNNFAGQRQHHSTKIMWNHWKTEKIKENLSKFEVIIVLDDDRAPLGHKTSTDTVTSGPLQCRHNELDGVSNHRRLDCLLNGLFRRRSRKTSKLRASGLCEGYAPVAGEFPVQRYSDVELPFDDVIMVPFICEIRRSVERNRFRFQIQKYLLYLFRSKVAGQLQVEVLE